MYKNTICFSPSSRVDSELLENRPHLATKHIYPRTLPLKFTITIVPVLPRCKFVFSFRFGLDNYSDRILFSHCPKHESFGSPRMLSPSVAFLSLYNCLDTAYFFPRTSFPAQRFSVVQSCRVIHPRIVRALHVRPFLLPKIYIRPFSLQKKITPSPHLYTYNIIYKRNVNKTHACAREHSLLQLFHNHK